MPARVSISTERERVPNKIKLNIVMHSIHVLKLSIIYVMSIFHPRVSNSIVDHGGRDVYESAVVPVVEETERFGQSLEMAVERRHGG